MRLLLRRIDARRRGNSRGYSLVEVVISILIASVIVTSVFSVALTSKTVNGQNGRNDRHQIAGQAMNEISSALRNFVTGCCDVAADTCKPTTGAYACTVLGPNSANAAMSGYSFDGYVLSGGAVTDNFGAPAGTRNTYALYGPGTHYLTGVLPSWFTGAPYLATVSYTVATTALPNWPNAAYPATAVMPQVIVNVNWTEP